MPTSVSELVASADKSVPRIAVEEARRLQSEEGALLLDVRDPPELAQGGKLRGAVNVSRGMLEFRADSASQSHDKEFRTDRPVIVYCGSGGRAALSGKALQSLGYDRVYNLGAFKDAAEAGFPTEQA